MNVLPRLFPVGLAAVLAAAMLPLGGCGGQSGPARYDLSGTVTYDGQPVPAGEVVLEPDGSKGNTGPGSLATIRDGKYQTEPAMGVVGGAYIARITGFDGVPVGDLSQGTPLFSNYTTTIDLPHEAATHDFQVPADGHASP